MSDIENCAGAFVQPSLESPQPGFTGNADLPETALVLRESAAQAVDNSRKTDELSLALAESRKPVPANLAPEPAPVGKYALDYSLHGQAIHETHSTVRSALARVAALGRLGIVPATSTNV